MKLSKCSFGSLIVEYFSHIISVQIVAMDPQKVACILSWPVSKTIKDLRGFLGLTGYYRCL